MLYSGIGPRSGTYPKSPYPRLIEPPISTTRLSFLNARESRSIAPPILVSGPIATSVISPGAFRVCSSRKSTASIFFSTGAPSLAQRACEKLALLLEVIPSAIGIPVEPFSFRKRCTSCARNSVSPQAVEIPTISTSGLRKASASANTSSMSSPISVSRMILVFAAPATGACWAKLAIGKNICPAVQTIITSRTLFKIHNLGSPSIPLRGPSISGKIFTVSPAPMAHQARLRPRREWVAAPRKTATQSNCAPALRPHSTGRKWPARQVLFPAGFAAHRLAPVENELRRCLETTSLPAAILEPRNRSRPIPGVLGQERNVLPQRKVLFRQRVLQEPSLPLTRAAANVPKPIQSTAIHFVEKYGPPLQIAPPLPQTSITKTTRNRTHSEETEPSDNRGSTLSFSAAPDHICCLPTTLPPLLCAAPAVAAPQELQQATPGCARMLFPVQRQSRPPKPPGPPL